MDDAETMMNCKIFNQRLGVKLCCPEIQVRIDDFAMWTNLDILFSFLCTERVCTLSGAKEAVTHAKDLLNKLCNDNNASSAIESISCILIPPAGASGYPPYQEIMVPGSKVGLVIGKGGETIKMLQEKTGAKMVIIQDGPGQELVVSVLQIEFDTKITIAIIT